jgi:hypothetical protein
MPPFDVLPREHGKVQETEEDLRKVPIPRRKSSQAPVAAPSQAAPAQPGQPTSYERDIRATNPLANVPVDVQEKLHRAKMWYEIAAHPGATPFEIALANAHYDELDDTPKEEDQDESKDKKE